MARSGARLSGLLLSFLAFLLSLLVFATQGVKPIDVDGTKIFTADEIAKFDGSNPDLPLYMAIKGIVFDVSTGKDFYGKGQSYNALIGKDSTRAVAKMSLDPKDLNSDVSDLSKEHLEFLDKIFEGTYKEKYPIVGYMDYLAQEKLSSKDKSDL